MVLEEPFLLWRNWWGFFIVSLTRLECVQALQSLNYFMRFSSPSSLASSDFLGVPPLTRICSNLPFETQERSWRLESHLQKMRDKSVSFPTGPHLVSELNKLCKIIATIEHKHLYQTTLMWRSHYNEFRLPNWIVVFKTKMEFKHFQMSVIKLRKLKQSIIFFV